MAFVLADRVKESCTSPGTGTATLLGAATGYQSFSSGIGASNTTYYTIADQSGANWEVGFGTIGAGGTTLARTTVYASSNSGSLVNFSSGSQDVWCDYTASKYVSKDSIYAPGTFLGTFSDGVVMDYTTGTGRFSVGTSDGFAWYNGGVANTSLMTLSTAGSLSVIADSTINGIKFGKGPGSLNNNIFISQYPNTVVSGSGNIGIGGSFNLTSGTLNNAVGTGSLNSTTTGSGNQAFGYGAGSSMASSASYNMLYGFSAGQYLTGSYNTVVGAYSGLTGVLSSGQSNYVVLADGNGGVKEYYDNNANEFLSGNYRTNASTMAVTQTIASGQNTMSIGPITISDGVTITIADGGNWVIV